MEISRIRIVLEDYRWGRICRKEGLVWSWIRLDRKGGM